MATGAFFPGASTLGADDEAAAMMDGLPPICPVEWPNPEKTGAAGAGAGAGADDAGDTKPLPRAGFPPICPVACPKPEKIGVAGVTGTGAGAETVVED